MSAVLLHQILFAMLCLLTCSYAVVRGGAPERVTACGFIAAFVMTNLVRSPLPVTFRGVEWRIALVDAALLAAIIVVALRSTRYWGISMASMQIADMLGHVARMLDPLIVPKAYYMLAAVVGWPEVVLLLAATWLHQRRLERWGIDYDWVSQLPPAYRAGWLAVERTGARATTRGSVDVGSRRKSDQP